MFPLDWPFLDALQTGALTALFITFGSDAFSRRDGMMGLLALSCLLVALRHAVLALGASSGLNPDLLDRAQSFLVALGFLTLCLTLRQLFPNQVPRRFPGWIALGLVPNFLRNLLLPHPSTAELWLQQAANLTFLVGCGAAIHFTLRARVEGDPMGRRLFLGFLGVTLPVVVEIAALSLFDMKVRLSGFSLVMLAMAIGNSWQRLVVGAMESRIHAAQTEAEAWRSLIPGTAFRTDRPSTWMDTLFGDDWPDRLRSGGDTQLVGADGATYRIRSRSLPGQDRLGWCERDDAQPGAWGFLTGWAVGLGMDDATEAARIQALLQSWGADVELWGTLPPREGPYPSILLWAREPSILAVWREFDLIRRRARWVQIGGPITKGPHARLEPGATGEVLRRHLEELLSKR